jgi:hypothetical protein
MDACLVSAPRDSHASLGPFSRRIDLLCPTPRPLTSFSRSLTTRLAKNSVFYQQISVSIYWRTTINMPQSYHRRYSDYPPPARTIEPRRRSSYALAPASPPTTTSTTVRDTLNNAAPQLTDADDSIVLSDLIRSGEQSRLRRRGAMRLDHSDGGATLRILSAGSSRITNTSAAAAPQTQSVSRPGGLFMRPSTPPWLPYPSGSFGEDDAVGYNDSSSWINENDGGPANASTGPANEEQRQGGDPVDVEESYILHCGGDDGISDLTEDKSMPFVPSPLAWSSQRNARPSASSYYSRKTNGCGAVLHVRAFPQKPRGVWVGKEEATDVVVGMESSYFERTVVARMMRSTCGCVREGIGCAVCGNPLGTRYMPCQAASEGLFSNAGRSTTRGIRPLHPSGSRYWQTMSRSNTSISRPSSRPGTSRQGCFYVYTFFSTQVSSSPICPFPPLPKLPQRSPEIITPYAPSSDAPRVIPPITTTWLGYSPTTSPQPYSPIFAPAPTEPGIPRPRSRSPSRRSPGLRLSIPSFQLPLPVGRSNPNASSHNERTSAVAVATIDGSQLDADGVPIGGELNDVEPDSPDKTTTDGMLWSSR